MNVLVLAENGAPTDEIVEAYRAAGHEVVVPMEGPREARIAEATRTDLRDLVVVDVWPPGAEAVRRSVEALARVTAHYVLVSSCEVYPNVPHLRPWSASAMDVDDEAPFETLPARARSLRAAERELRIVARGLPWTIVRPSVVDSPRASRSAAWVWRILEGGPIVLPDAGVALYRHISSHDLGRALVAVSGEARAFSQTLDVAGEGLVSPWGHVAMLCDALGRPKEFAYVQAERFRAAGLALPYDDVRYSSFVEPSPLLHDLGFRATDELAFVYALARALAHGPLDADHDRRRRELQLVDDARRTRTVRFESRTQPPASRAPTGQWLLTAEAGAPASLAFERFDAPGRLGPLVFKVRELALGLAERMLLVGDLPTRPGRRCIGHNALLEVIEGGGPQGPAPGTLTIPLARRRCDDAACTACREDEDLVLGLDEDGFGLRFGTLHASHLVEVPPRQAAYALLADPLAVVEEALEGISPGVVWIAGSTPEAALAGFVARDAGHDVHHVDFAGAHPRTKGHPTVHTIRVYLHEVRVGHMPAPTVALELSGSPECAFALAAALAPGGTFIGHRAPHALPAGATYRALPRSAGSRARLRGALARLERWSQFRDLGALRGPNVPADRADDAFLAPPFTQAVVEDPS